MLTATRVTTQNGHTHPAREEMKLSRSDKEKFKALEDRLRTILPEEYQDTYKEVQPVSMGSAALKYGSDGKVAWDDIWVKFCDLAMAGGPPHKGMLLEPGSPAEIEAEPDAYQRVVDEVIRGVTMVTGFAAYASAIPGWVSVDLVNMGTTEWLLRAITMENISVWRERMVLNLPAGPAYRVEKEVKNVITSIAKTTHYWFGHTRLSRRWEIATLFSEMDSVAALIEPALAGRGYHAGIHHETAAKMADTILHSTGLASSKTQCAGWLGVECPSVPVAVWMMRACVACNVLSRREGTAVFVPVNPVSDPGGERVARLVFQLYRFAETVPTLWTTQN
jgi:sirohydrochlorin cobaltochelatase